MVKVIYDKQINQWRECVGDEQGIYLDGFLKQKLDRVKEVIKKNWDAIFIIVGQEGSGKSTLGFVCGQYLSDMGLTIGNIAEGSSDAMKKLQSLPNGSVLICDEAELLFSSRETMSREQKQLTQIFKVIRQKNMILILISPVFFDLSKYIAVDRARFLIRTYANSKLERGFFNYWGTRKKLKLYIEGKKRHGSYSKPKANFNGRFVEYKLPFDEEYQKLKGRSLEEAFKGKNNKEDTAVIEIEKRLKDNITIRLIEKEPDKPNKYWADLLNHTIDHIKYLKAVKMGGFTRKMIKVEE
jgi:hypothetical protein